MKGHLWPAGAKRDHVAVGQEPVAREPLAVDERPVRTADVAQCRRVARHAHLRVPRRDIGILFEVEAEVTVRVPADRDACLVERLTLARARARPDAELDRHQLFRNVTRTR